MVKVRTRNILMLEVNVWGVFSFCFFNMVFSNLSVSCIGLGAICEL